MTPTPANDSRAASGPFTTRNVLIGAAAILILAAWLWATIQDEARSVTKTVVSAESKAEGEDVRLDLWVDDGRVVFDEPVAVWLTVVNRTGAAIDVNFAAFRAPGFVVPRKGKLAECWNREGYPVCQVNGGAHKPLDRLPLTLKKDEAVTLTGDLLAGHDAGRYSIAAVVAWSPSGKPMTRHKPISVGPVAIEHPWRNYMAIFLKTLKAFVKELALPIALGLFALFLKRRESDMTMREQELESKRACT